MIDFIYETPWWLPVGCAVVGIILFVTGNNRLDRTLKRAGIALFALGILIGLLSYLLESPREQVIRHTRQLVRACENRDWDAMQALLHPDLKLVGWAGRAAIVRGARYYTETYDLKSAAVTGIDAAESDGEATVTMQVIADFKDASAVITRWKLEWLHTRQGWLVVSVQPLGGPQIDPSVIERRFRGPAE